jgi:hypothetical protein
MAISGTSSIVVNKRINDRINRFNPLAIIATTSQQRCDGDHTCYVASAIGFRPGRTTGNLMPVTGVTVKAAGPGENDELIGRRFIWLT